MLVTNCVSWAVTLCHGASSSWRFEGSQLFHLQGPCLTLKMNTLQSFKTPGNIDPVTKCHVPDDLTDRSYGRFLRPATSSKNLKYSGTVWPVTLHPQRTPLCSSYRVLSIRKSVRGCSVPTVPHILLFRRDTCITVMLRLCPLCELYV